MISNKDVQHIAGLARIHLRDEEIQPLAQDLEQILNYIATLNELDVTEVEPTSHVFPLKNVMRADEPQPSFTQEEALSFAVDKAQGAFKVPKVIE